MSSFRYIVFVLAVTLLLGAACGAVEQAAEPASPEESGTPPSQPAGEPAPEAPSGQGQESENIPGEALPRTDYLTYAHGVWLVSVSHSGAPQPPSRSNAFQTYDGLPVPRNMLANADHDAQLELIYELPALTTFDRLAVPDITEVPSPSVTFFREYEVAGSGDSVDSGYTVLARGEFETHGKRGEVTELELLAQVPVRFVRLRLRGGIQNLMEKMGYQFSELIGNGTQQTVPLETGFTGIWDTRLPDVDRSSGLIEFKQEGVAVTGCAPGRDITGTVSGNILRATGVGRDDGTPSQYVLLIDSEGSIRGSASVNNGPFTLYGGPVAPEGSTTDCSDIPQPELGCGSTVYVQFEFNSARLRAESDPILSDLFEGLQAAPESTIVIEGHTSSEGSDEYNQVLSERRAQSVVDDLVRRGLASGRISAAGKGEHQPIASNNDEAGRSLNRRVEVVCR